MMIYPPLTDKAKRLRTWINHNLKNLTALQMIDDEIFHIEREASADRENVTELLAIAHERRAAAEAALKEYRSTLSAMITTADLSGYRPKTESDLRRLIYLRYYRGLPLRGKNRAATCENKTGLSVSMLNILSIIALNRLADVWEE